MMAPAAAEEDRGIAPPASALEQQLASLMAPTPTKEEEEAAMDLMEALEVMEILYWKISVLLEAAGPWRIATDPVSHCFAFMKAELSATMVSLRMRFFPSRLWDSRIDIPTGWWLADLKEEANSIMELLGGCQQKQVERPRHSLLRKSAQLFARLNPRHNREYVGIIQKAERFLYVAENPLRYKHLLSSSDFGLELPSHQAVAEERGLGHVGIESQTKKLLRWLMTGAEKSLRVMSIVGPAGVGKTSLAMEVYDQLQCQSSGGGHHFQCHAMAKWSRNPDIYFSNKIYEHILSQITGTMEPSVGNISELLREKRYFILIDDIWTTSDWKVIKSWFPSNNCGSRILITTRNRSVARFCSFEQGGLVHEMKPLNELDSERLLITKTFGSTEASPQDDLINNVLGEILRRCGGIPLFLIGMADWLKQQLQQEQQRQHEQLESLEQVPKLLEKFEQALWPTYDELPYMTKLLSLYMSMFPEGYVFEKYHLITKWSKEWPTLGIVWGEYFLELVDRNIITRMAKKYRHNLDETEACRWEINYFMLQFLTSKSEEEGFVLTGSTVSGIVAEEEGGGNNTLMVRRLAHHHTNPKLPMLLQRMDLSQTRSLAASGAANEIPFEKLSYLVVLDLEGWEKLDYEQLLQICNCNMFMLMYLSIRNTRVSKIPPQIKKLYNLTKLDISHTQISELPLEVCELEHLRKLDLRSTQIRQLPEEIVKLKDLQDVLVGNHGMINPFETATKVPQGISSVHKLETLAIVDLSDSSASFMDALGDLKSLRVLAITWSFHQCTDTANRSSLRSSIKKWKSLESLTIHCGPGCPMEFLGLPLSDRPENLERFKVTTGKFDNIPQWIEGLKNLTFLQITVCKHIPDNLKILKELDKLDHLVLGLEFIPTQEIVIESDGFSELRKFCVVCPVPWLTFKKEAMPKLTHLELKVFSGPAGQRRVPSGINNLQGIMAVHIFYTKWCEDSPNVKMVVDALKKEVAKHHNPINLFINDNIQDVDAQRNDNLLRRAANCLDESRALLLPKDRLEQLRASWQSILQEGIMIVPLLLLYCCWLHVSVCYVG